MPAAGREYRTPTPHDLAEDDMNTDRRGGRRFCNWHPTQEMIPLAKGLDACPLPHDEGEGS